MDRGHAGSRPCGSGLQQLYRRVALRARVALTGRRLDFPLALVFLVTRFALLAFLLTFLPAALDLLPTALKSLSGVFRLGASAVARRRGMSEGTFATGTPARSNRAILSCAVPAPPDTIAPACPIRFPGGAVCPAMKTTTGLEM